MSEPAVSVKAIIANDAGDVLLLKRAHDDPHRPGEWEVPGGRLEHGETETDGLRRQVREETDLRIDIGSRLIERSYQRDDGQWVRMVTFACRIAGPPNVTLTQEHCGHQWAALDEARRITQSFDQEWGAYGKK